VIHAATKQYQCTIYNTFNNFLLSWTKWPKYGSKSSMYFKNTDNCSWFLTFSNKCMQLLSKLVTITRICCQPEESLLGSLPLSGSNFAWCWNTILQYFKQPTVTRKKNSWEGMEKGMAFNTLYKESDSLMVPLSISSWYVAAKKANTSFLQCGSDCFYKGTKK